MTTLIIVEEYNKSNYQQLMDSNSESDLLNLFNNLNINSTIQVNEYFNIVHLYYTNEAQYIILQNDFESTLIGKVITENQIKNTCNSIFVETYTKIDEKIIVKLRDTTI